MVAGDESLALESSHALEAWGGRQADAFGQVDVGDAPVALKHVEDAAIEAVERTSFRGAAFCCHLLSRKS
jgi:hypothetical protein